MNKCDADASGPVPLKHRKSNNAAYAVIICFSPARFADYDFLAYKIILYGGNSYEEKNF